MNKRILDVFDFDGTCANVPERPQGDKRAWNGKDWWGSKQSLCSPEEGGFYEDSPNMEVIEAFRQSQASPEADTIMLTGRRGVIAFMVRKILRELGLTGLRVMDESKKKDREWFRRHCDRGDDQEDAQLLHEQYFCGDVEVTNGMPGTFGHKAEVLMRKVRGNGGSYEKINIWDDRVDHIEMFKNLAQQLLRSGQVQEFTIHQVFPPKVEGAEAYVIHIPITKETSWKKHG